MNLNGWHRLWVLAAVAWALAVTAGIGQMGYVLPDLPRYARDAKAEVDDVCRGTAPPLPGISEADSFEQRSKKRSQAIRRGTIEDSPFTACHPIAARFVSWLTPVVLVYPVVWAVVWVRRGFATP